jgi:hypothetical protein
MFLDRCRFIWFFGLASPCARNQEKDRAKNKKTSRDRLQRVPPV